MKIFELFKKLSTDEFCFAYMDVFSDTVTDALIEIQEARTDTPRKISKKIAFLLTECFQNIIRHSEETTSGFDKFFSLRNLVGCHQLVTINPINKEKEAYLRESINNLDKLNEAELKAAYLHALENNSFSDQGGAGLGLIEMARKTKRTPKLSFATIDENLVKFILELSIPEYEVKSPTFPSEQLAEELKKNKVLLIQKGNFSQENVISLFELIEQNLGQNAHSGDLSKKLYLLIELLQNMSTNSLETDRGKEGIFQIRRGKKSAVIFETGNYMNAEDAVKLKAYLDTITALNGIEIQKKYKEELLKGLKENNKGNGHAGIGLLEIIKLSGGQLTYEAIPIDSTKTFFTMAATIG